MADKFPPAKGPKVPPMQPRITINIGESASSAQLRRLIRDRHAAWSQETFGDVGPIGPLKHLAKEALEATAAPDDLSEWADLQFLLWDAQRRAGISDGEITAAMEEKLKVNMARQWPEPKDGEPRLHIKEPGNSPVIPDGWIPCSDRMPGNSGAYLCFIEDEDEPELQCLVFEWLQSHRKFNAAGLKITHWMSLPVAPQQEKNRG